jgi:ribosomal protein L15E|tara:strand:- start:573 stop:845 length:273 start_codon:yes stop_codon:yes gene_type:complete
MGKLIPNQALIYERSEGVVYARYRDPPHNKIPRWVIGGEPDATAKALGIVSYDEWKNVMRIAESNANVKKQFDRLMTMYYVVKDEQEEIQ